MNYRPDALASSGASAIGNACDSAIVVIASLTSNPHPSSTFGQGCFDSGRDCFAISFSAQHDKCALQATLFPEPANKGLQPDLAL